MTRIRNVRNTTKFKRSIKAISPVIATLLMIAIAVVASLVVYAWVSGYMGTTTTKAGKAIQIQSYAPTGTDPLNPTNLLVYVQNVGQGDVELSQTQSVYIDSNLVTISNPNTAKIPITVGQTVELTVPLPTGYHKGDTLNIKVTTTDGTFMTATGTGTSSSSGGSGGAGPLSKFVVGAPTSTTTNTAFTLTVTAEDASGTIITTYSSSVGLTASAGTLAPATTGTTGWTNGVWTSTTATLSSAGNPITITASDGTHTGTAPVTVTASGPGPLSKFVVGAPTSTTTNTAFTLTVTAEDASGTIITTYSSSVGLTASAGTLAPATTGTTGWTNGVWTSTTATLSSAGNPITITASDGTHTGTAPVTVTASGPGPLSKFVVGAPTSTTTNTAFTLTVTAEDASGTIITTYSSSVGLTASAGTLAPATTGTTGWTNGVWTSTTATLSSAGNPITITASDGTHTGTAPVTVTASGPGPLSKFVVGAPTSTTTNTAFTLTVTAEDASGTIITTYSSSVGLTASAGTLAPATTGTTGWTNGVWTSTTATLSSAGNPITITASDGTHTGTAPVVVTAPAAPALDGSGVGGSTTGTSIQLTVAPTKSNDLLYVSVVEDSGDNGRHVTGITSAGATWSIRTSLTQGAITLETWYAISPSSGSTQITVTLTQAQQHSVSAVAFAVSGVKTATPFDVNYQTNSGHNVASISKAITTATANDLIISAIGIEQHPAMTLTGGSTLIKTQTDGANRQTSDAWLSAATIGPYTPGYSWTGSNDCALIVEALKPA